MTSGIHCSLPSKLVLNQTTAAQFPTTTSSKGVAQLRSRSVFGLFTVAILAVLALMAPDGLRVSAQTRSSGEGQISKPGMNPGRGEAAKRHRRLIFNNDGNDAVHFPGTLEATDENLLNQRTAPLLNTQVDTISYCTNRGIGLVLHRSKVNQVLLAETREKAGAYAEKRNIIGELNQRGTDPLEIMAKFCRRNGKELFWSMRMNDVHDAGNSSMLSQFKRDHPEHLFGTPKAPPPYRGYSDAWGGTAGTLWGGYSAVDYGREEVRKLVFQTVEEVCQNYDIDGVELDFCRSPVIFKSQAWNQEVTDTERGHLTELIRAIREMADAVAAKRRRPLLLAVRVPDSVPYCYSVGIDLEAWLGEGHLDLLIPGADFLLSPWETTVALGHKHGVPVYPALTRAPTSANPGYGERGTLECYRGRAKRIWDSGADGIYLFNIFQPTMPILKEIGDETLLNTLDQIHYGSEMPTWHARVYHRNGLAFRVLPLLSPEHPHRLEPGMPLTTTVDIPEDLRKAGEKKMQVKLGLKVEALKAASPLIVALNGHPLAEAQPGKQWLEFEVRREWTLHGENVVSVRIEQPASETPVISDVRISVMRNSAR